MNKYTTRVELFDTDDGTSEEYTKLHAAMEKAGFSRTIKSDEGHEYHLPPAEYNFEGNRARKEVIELAKTAAAKSGKEYSVIVTESNGRTWHNLKPVKKLIKR
jgi:hypothetical protein